MSTSERVKSIDPQLEDDLFLKNLERVEAGPQVLIDADLALSHDLVDFNYLEYAARLKARGLTDDQINETKVKLSSPTTPTLPGSYDRKTTTIEIRIGNADMTVYNKALNEQTERRICHAQNPKQYDKYLQHVATWGGLVVFVSGGGVLTQYLRDFDPAILAGGTGSMIGGLVMMGVGIKMKTIEEKSLAAMPEVAPHIITLRPKIPV